MPHIYRLMFFSLLLGLAPLYGQAQNSTWEPADPRLPTKWTEQVTPENVHQEYPRPQMQRDSWKNLNGLWSYAINPLLEESPSNWSGTILVPFGIESALSGIKKRVGPDHKLWYRRTFSVPSEWIGQRLLLHFEAVDWKSKVWVNGTEVCSHTGGYTSFSCDITEALNTKDTQKLTVSVWDPTDEGFQPRGKQVRDPHSIWYTPTTGIWQTVWLEPVPEVAVQKLKMVPDIDNQFLNLRVITNTDEEKKYRVRAAALENGKKISETSGSPGKLLQLSIPNMKLWSPGQPFLYDLVVTLEKDGQKIDEVQSYFGMREIRVGTAEDGYRRLFLNDQPLFHLGLLDQGFWPDGIYTAPTDEALKFDIEITKKLGFNMIRKHVKVEPDRWYYWADKLGILVWQDMPNGDRHIGPNDPDINRVAQSARNYKLELKEMVSQLYNHPSIVTWVPFNEGWGQFQTARIADLVKKLDSSRLVDIPSGWADRGVGDVNDIHSYPGPDMPQTEEDRAAVLGEFGGQALVVREHLWINDFSRAPSHYKTSQSKTKLHATYEKLIKELYQLKKQGLAAAVYTQTTDVESEVNGIMTYDRKVIKFGEKFMQNLHAPLTETTFSEKHK